MRKIRKYAHRTVMARVGVDYETIKHAAVKLLSQGIAPSVQKIRETLGTGSNTTIAEHLKVWRDEYAKKAIHHLPANMPKELISTFEVLWQTAMEHAQNQLAAYKLTVESEQETALQVKRDAEKTVASIKLQLLEISSKLEQAIESKQNLITELAVKNDRLIKQSDILSAQKNQYEERLKRIYKEKDILISQYSQLQSDVKVLQEKLTLQSEQHQNLLAQQNILHEQSENRWLTFVDQAKQETKEANKQLENVRHNYDEKIKKLDHEIQNTLRILHEKSTYLAISLEQIDQLKLKIKNTEKEAIQSKATIIKLEEELQSKNIIISTKKKSQIEKSSRKMEL
jgi:chromosome segregation ATPase